MRTVISARGKAVAAVEEAAVAAAVTGTMRNKVRMRTATAVVAAGADVAATVIAMITNTVTTTKAARRTGAAVVAATTISTASVLRSSPATKLDRRCSQNRKTVTDHAGKCRKFWVYRIQGGQIAEKTLLELPIEQSLHESPVDQPHPLDGVHALIAGSMGEGTKQRLILNGIRGLVTDM